MSDENYIQTLVWVSVNKLWTFSEPRVFADILQSCEVAFVLGALEQPCITQGAIIAFFRLLFLFIEHTRLITVIFIGTGAYIYLMRSHGLVPSNCSNGLSPYE